MRKTTWPYHLDGVTIYMADSPKTLVEGYPFKMKEICLTLRLRGFQLLDFTGYHRLGFPDFQLSCREVNRKARDDDQCAES